MMAGAGMAVAAMTVGVAAPAMAVNEYSYYVNGYYARYSDHPFYEGYDYAASQVSVQHFDVVGGRVYYYAPRATPGHWSMDNICPANQSGDGMAVYVP